MLYVYTVRPLPSLASRAHHRTRPWARAQWLRVPPPEASLGGGRRGLRPPHWPVRAFTVTESAARAFLSVMPTALGDKSPRWAVTGRVRPDAARMRWQGHRMEERTSSGVPSQGAHPSRPQTPPPTSTPPRTPTPLFVVAGTAKALTSACCGGGWGVRWCPSGRRQFLAPRHGTARSRLLPAVGAGRVEHTPRLRLERALVARDGARPCTRPPNGCRAHAAHGARGGPSAPSPPHAAPLPIQPSPSSPFPPAPHPIHPPLPARAGWPTPRRPVFFFFASCSLVGVRGGEEGGRGAGGWWVAACCGGGGEGRGLDIASPWWTQPTRWLCCAAGRVYAPSFCAVPVASS